MSGGLNFKLDEVFEFCFKHTETIHLWWFCNYTLLFETDKIHDQIQIQTSIDCSELNLKFTEQIEPAVV